MTDCTTVRSRLTALRDGELSPALRARFEAHLAGCSGCAREWHEIGATLDAADAWQPAEGDRDICNTVRAEIVSAPATEVIAALRAEMEALRAEMNGLRQEVAALRSSGVQAAAAAPPSEPARSVSAFLFPYPPPLKDPQRQTLV